MLRPVCPIGAGPVITDCRHIAANYLTQSTQLEIIVVSVVGDSIPLLTCSSMSTDGPTRGRLLGYRFIKSGRYGRTLQTSHSLVLRRI